MLLDANVSALFQCCAYIKFASSDGNIATVRFDRNPYNFLQTHKQMQLKVKQQQQKSLEKRTFKVTKCPNMRPNDGLLQYEMIQCLLIISLKHPLRIQSELLRKFLYETSHCSISQAFQVYCAASQNPKGWHSVALCLGFTHPRKWASDNNLLDSFKRSQF